MGGAPQRRERVGPRRHLARLSLLFVFLLFAQGSPAGPHDHDRARAALERGEVRPIAEVLAAVADQVPGDVVEVELEREHGRWAYELKLIAPDGRILEVLVDAASATIIKTEQD
jgi:uncharacterized membrane protein YkoI